MDPDLDSLRAVPLFHGVDEINLKAVLAAGRKKSVPEGSFLFYQGDPADHLYVLTAGRMKLSQITTDGQQVILNMIGTWEMFGLIAFTEGGNYPASAEAVIDCEVIGWSRDNLRRLAEQIPLLALNGMKLMAQRVQDFQNRVRELSTERVERRLARVLLRLVRQVGKKAEDGVLIDLPLSRQDLAEMSGTTLYTVSRILSQWDRQGLVDIGRERVLIRFPHGLVRIAEDLPSTVPPDQSEK